MVKINLIPRQHGSLIRSRQIKPRTIEISRRSAELAASRLFSLNSPLMLMAGRPPISDLTALKTEIIDALRSKERYSEQDLEVLEQAFDLMVRFHEHQTFPNGEKVTIHLLEVARTLCEWGCSPVLAAAGLLHLIPMNILAKENISTTVQEMVLKKNRLSRYLYIDLEGPLTDRESRYLSKMCLMQESDRDVWLLESADAFHTLRSLSHSEGAKTHRLASRSFNVTSPILSMLDLDHIAVKLENIAFLRLDKAEYERIEKLIENANQRDRIEALKHLASLVDLISEELKRIGLEHRVETDVKSVTRTMKKLKKGEELTDASRFRIIVRGGPAECKTAFENVISAMEALGYTEYLNERRNFVAGISLGEPYDLGPKANGYQSIHAHVRGEKFEPINIQIRDEMMHEIAEQGSASHGRFKLNGLLSDSVIDEATSEQARLIKEGRRYGFYQGQIYRLIPYDKSKPVRLRDLLFAVSPKNGLRSPDIISVKRFDPVTGIMDVIKLPVQAALENGDTVMPFKLSRTAHTARIRLNQLNTLNAIVTLKMASHSRLDEDSWRQRSSSVSEKGKTALGIELSDWRNQLRQRLTTVLSNEGESIADLKIDTMFSQERAAKAIGATTEDAMHLAIGLAQRQSKAKLIDTIMRTISSSSVALAYKIGRQRNQVDFWLMVNDTPGAYGQVLSLFNQHSWQHVSLSSRPLAEGFFLIKARVKTRKKDIEEDVLGFLGDSRDLYQQTKPFPPGIPTVRHILFDIRPPKLNLRQISDAVRILNRLRIRINTSNFPPVLEGRAQNRLVVDLPAGASESVLYRLHQELKKIGIVNFKTG